MAAIFFVPMFEIALLLVSEHKLGDRLLIQYNLITHPKRIIELMNKRIPCSQCWKRITVSQKKVTKPVCDYKMSSLYSTATPSYFAIMHSPFKKVTKLLQGLPQLNCGIKWLNIKKVSVVLENL